LLSLLRLSYFVVISFGCSLFIASPDALAHFLVNQTETINVKSDTEFQNKPKVLPQTIHYNFASIELLIEQEVGRIVIPQIYKNIGINVTVTPLPAQRAQFVANTGEKDGEIMRIWSYGDENIETIRVPTPYYYLETMPFSLKERQLDIRDKNDLKKYKLAKVRGVKHTNNITKGMNNVYEMTSTENMFKMLINGIVDVALTNTLDGKLTLERLGYGNIEYSIKPLAVLPLYHYINKKHKALVPVINQEILRIRENGELKAMINRAEQQVISLNHR
jgi:polar amino acid transport system substrate-binding protein